VDDVIIVYNANKTDEQTILNQANKIDKPLQFKLTKEKHNIINYLDLNIKRNDNELELEIYHKPTSTDTTIHYTSNHPHEHKMAAFHYYINRVTTLPITEQAKQKEWKFILNMANNNGFPHHIIHNTRKKYETNTQQI
jgi:hypothetical protein